VARGVDVAQEMAVECFVDLGALQDDPSFVFLQYLIVVMGFFVAGDEMDGQRSPYYIQRMQNEANANAPLGWFLVCATLVAFLLNISLYYSFKFS
jgi:hypothetical protein